MNTSNHNFRFTKAGAIILTFTLIFSTLFVVLGAVNLAENGNSSSPDDGSNIIGTYWAYEGSTTHISAKSGKYYEVKFSPNATGTHTISMDGAYVISVTKANGNTVSYDRSYNSYYDYSYTVYLSSSYTYTIQIKATDDNVLFFAEY